jgi:spermidine/putrescine transport system ATP-binding protein
VNVNAGGIDTAAVALRGIVKRFGDVAAVDHVDLDIADGEFFALLGPSGCGKTTTLRMIAGLEFPTEGSLKIFGDEVGTLPPNKRPVNTVFQSYALFPHLSVTDNVAFGMRMRKVAKAEARRRAGEALELVQLGNFGNRKPAQLSGGQQQRVALARAIVNQPKVLLLDEPLAALDLKLRQGMQAELKSIQRELGITFVFVTHDQEEALTMSDRIGVMHQGQLLQVGGPEDIYERPSSRFVADFIGRTNFLPGTVADANTVVLENGTRLQAPAEFLAGLAAGSSVSLSIRPERLDCLAADSTRDGRPGLPGVVARATYLGDSIVYDVAIDWMHLEVRHENDPAQARFDPGAEVFVSWHPEAATVVPNDAPAPEPVAPQL